MQRRLLGAAVAVLALVLAAPAAAAPPGGRIVNGTLAAQGEYPAQGFVQIDLDGNGFGPGDSFCGGTLVGTRQILTAAHCTTDDLGLELPASAFRIRLGNVDRSAPAPDQYFVVDNDTNADFSLLTFRNDTAMLTLNRPAPYGVMRVVEDSEDALWEPGVLARIIGWGDTSDGGTSSRFLRKADVPIIEDSRCAAAYPGPPPTEDFDPATMVCAADAPGTAAPRDTCQGDSGGPLLVPDGGFFALAGTVSWGIGCADPDNPGVYARVGDQPLNGWVHARTPEADFDFDHAPRANEPVTLTSTSRHPDGPAYFTQFNWDLDNDGAFDDAAGKTVTHTFPAPGEQVAGLEASRPGGDKASVYYAFSVGEDPSAAPPPVVQASTTPPAPPPAAATAPAGPAARIVAGGRPRVRGGRFTLRIRFARDAPRGIAVVVVYKGRRKIGVGRTRVRRGATKRVRVKLTRTGRRLLRDSSTRRLRVRVRVRVGDRRLASRRLTIQRAR